MSSNFQLLGVYADEETFGKVEVKSLSAETLTVEKNYWQFTEWSECDNFCGKGLQTRNYFCILSKSSNYEPCLAWEVPGLVLKQECVNWTKCPFDIMCPFGQWNDCGWQNSLIVGIITSCIVLFLIYIIYGCRTPKKGKTKLDLYLKSGFLKGNYIF